jgi:glycosyltransferase involved in cell wall biosynthesis
MVLATASNAKTLPLVTILTPTYNDAAHLPALIHSVFGQTYANWEWIVIDDGSSDNTQDVLREIVDPRVRILRKENGDQLNALAYALPHTHGDVVTMMHSDDTFVSPQSIAVAVEKLSSSGADGIYGDYQTMDGEGRPTGALVTPAVLDARTGVRTVVQMGTNFIGDPFFVWRTAFDNYVIPNYIRQNTIYYFGYDGNRSLKLIKSEPWYRYRVFSENYINSDVGKFVALSGQFRTVTRLLNAGVSPGLNVGCGYAWFRLARRIGLHLNAPLWSQSKIGARFFDFWSRDIGRHGYPEILEKIAKAISHSYSTANAKQRARIWENDSGIHDFSPPDARRFFRVYEQGGIPEICLSLLDRNFDHIVVKDEPSRNQVMSWLNFFSLQYQVVTKAS